MQCFPACTQRVAYISKPRRLLSSAIYFLNKFLRIFYIVLIVASAASQTRKNVSGKVNSKSCSTASMLDSRDLLISVHC